jgi:2-oxoglutarate ferredoxin oxidoreductase subunit beta
MTPDFKTSAKIVWCQGCGNFGIWASLQKAFQELNLRPDQILAVYGIGCHGHMANYLKINNFEGLHGRALPLATGAKIANQNLNVLAVVGDGDQLGEGGNHLIHASRRNPNITCVLHNNQLYSLTVGQASPASEKGMKTKSTPQGVFDPPLNPLALALASGATFVARGFAGDIPHLTKILVAGMKHRGFSLIEVLQPCTTLNHLNTFTWFRERIYKLEDKGRLPQDKTEAFRMTQEWGKKIPLGIFFQEERPTLEEQLLPDKDQVLAEQPLGLSIEKLLAEFR